MEKETNIKFISNWNLDGIPFKENEIKLNKKREFNDLCSYHYIEKFKLNTNKHLIISCFQECWTINNTFLIRYFTQTKINTLLDIFIIFLYQLIYPFILFFNISINQPEIIKEEISGILPYNYLTKGKNDKKKIVDSGLCILSNWKPIYKDFYKYKINNNSEIIITRGILLSIFIDDNDKVTTLLFNTQLSFDFYIQKNEIKELIWYVNNIKERFNGTRYQEIFIVGDFKSKIEELHIKDMCKELNLLVITPRKKKSHMFYWRNDPYVNLNFLYSGEVKNKLSRYNWDSIILNTY